MPDFRFYHPLEVRYADLDPQGHVNHAKFLTYMEQARFAYVRELGLWDGRSFLEIGMILAEARVSYRAPIQLGDSIRVGVRVSRLGTKSFDVEYRIEDRHTEKELANGMTVMVAYDYSREESIEIPEVWRHAISTFEGIPARRRHDE